MKVCVIASLTASAWSNELKIDHLSSRRIPHCDIDVSGRYISEYDIALDVTQKDCMVHVDPPGREAGMVTGRLLSIAGVKGHIDGNQIRFTNGAHWRKANVPKPPPTKPHSHKTAAVSMPSTTTSASANAKPTPFWSAIGGGLLVGGAFIADTVIAEEMAAKHKAAKPKQRPLPVGWSAAVDSLGHRYYWNDANPHDSTTWTRPTGEETVTALAKSKDTYMPVSDAPVDSGRDIRFLGRKDALTHDVHSTGSKTKNHTFMTVVVIAMSSIGLLVLAAIGYAIGNTMKSRFARTPEGFDAVASEDPAYDGLSLERSEPWIDVEYPDLPPLVPLMQIE